MGIEETPPNLVMRAMGQLAQKSPVQKGDAESSQAPSHQPPAKEDAASPDDSVETTARTLTSSQFAEHRNVELTPAAMAAHGLFSLATKNTRTIEEFRVIKRQVLGVIAKQSSVRNSDRNRLVMVTSSLPGEGKTHTSLNLAFSIAEERDKKVLLVDADVYRQSALEYLGLHPTKGWVDQLTEESLSLDGLILETNIPNLSLLPAGKAQANVPELLSSRGMTALVSELLMRHPDEIIVFDSLPCLISNEPALLSELVGQIIFVVAAHQTPKDKVRASLGIISGCPNIQLVLNKAEPILTDNFGKYGYGYDYNYKKTA